MPRRFPLAVALSLLAAPAFADDALLAEYWSRSGSLPPQYAWSVSATITQDGTLLIKHCTGYETEGPTCKTDSAKVTEAQMQSIREVAVAARLAETPARETEDIPVGGGSNGGAVWLGGAQLILPAWPVATDTLRVKTVLNAITEAIPQHLREDRF